MASQPTIGLTVPAALKEARRLETMASHSWFPRLKQLWRDDAEALRAAAARAIADAAVRARAEAEAQAAVADPVPVRRRVAAR